MWNFSFVFSLNNFLKLKPVKLFYILQQNKKKKLILWPLWGHTITFN